MLSLMPSIWGGKAKEGLLLIFAMLTTEPVGYSEWECNSLKRYLKALAGIKSTPCTFKPQGLS